MEKNCEKEFKIDDPIFVWNEPKEKENPKRMHFAGFNEKTKRVLCYAGYNCGCTSWTKEFVSPFTYWRKPTKEELEKERQQ